MNEFICLFNSFPLDNNTGELLGSNLYLNWVIVISIALYTLIRLVPDKLVLSKNQMEYNRKNDTVVGLFLRRYVLQPIFILIFFYLSIWFVWNLFEQPVVNCNPEINNSQNEENESFIENDPYQTDVIRP